MFNQDFLSNSSSTSTTVYLLLATEYSFAVKEVSVSVSTNCENHTNTSTAQTQQKAVPDNETAKQPQAGRSEDMWMSAGKLFGVNVELFAII